jgi:methylated-DNA-[protein]-cysteine S-methyltransferase
MTTDSLEHQLRTAPATDPTADLAAALTRAEAEGLVDVAYATADSPIGPLLVAATEAGLVRLAFDGEDDDAVLQDLAVRVAPRVVAAPRRLDEVRRAPAAHRPAARPRLCRATARLAR